MKVAVITNSISGLYHFRFEVLEALARDMDKVCVYAPLNKHTEIYALEFQKKGIEVINIYLNSQSKNPINEIKTILEIKKIKNKHHDYILTYTIKPNIYASLFFNNSKTKVIANVTGLGKSILNKPSSISSQFMLKLYTKSLLKNDVNFVQNEYIKKLLIEKEPRLFPKLKLIPGSGVNLDKFSYKSFPSLSDNTIKILFIGRIIESKGIFEFIEAVEKLSKHSTNYDYEFLVAGYLPGNMKKDVFGDKIKYVGKVQDPRQIYSKVHFVINPSHHEGMSNVLLEAAALGRPLLASNIPGCREIVSNNNGFLFEVQNANAIVETILKVDKLSYEEFEEMGKRSRDLVEKSFNREIVVKEYLEVVNNE